MVPFYSSTRDQPHSDPFPHRPTTRPVFFSTGFQRLRFPPPPLHQLSIPVQRLRFSPPPTLLHQLSSPANGNYRQHFSLQLSFHPSKLLQFRFVVRFYHRSIQPSNRSFFRRLNQFPRLCFTGFPPQRTAISDRYVSSIHSFQFFGCAILLSQIDSSCNLMCDFTLGTFVYFVFDSTSCPNLWFSSSLCHSFFIIVWNCIQGV